MCFRLRFSGMYVFLVHRLLVTYIVCNRNPVNMSQEAKAESKCKNLQITKDQWDQWVSLIQVKPTTHDLHHEIRLKFVCLCSWFPFSFSFFKYVRCLIKCLLFLSLFICVWWCSWFLCASLIIFLPIWLIITKGELTFLA